MLWIVGTSVSIEANGYAPRLAQRARDELGVAHANLSVGDQTSLMGCMRVLGQQHRIAAGDVVIWEYSLLDTLLTIEQFPPEDVHRARRLAWSCLLERGARVVVLMTPPKRHLAERSLHEAEIANDAQALGLRCIDLRELIAALELVDPAAHYRDDRHPRADSPLIDATVQALLDDLAEHHGRVAAPTVRQRTVHKRWRADIPWQWLDAAALARHTGVPTTTFRNSLLAIEAVALPVDARLGLATTTRIVSVGIVSTHVTGGLWCGHPGCAPAATRLPLDLHYDFLLRSTALPCVRAATDALAAAPAWAYACGLWAGYGQVLCHAPGTVAVFGLLHEPPSAGRGQNRLLDAVRALAARLNRGR
ncbi:MAG: hypothetical protein GXC76_13995 [Rhodanobacteraceae bacterium]|jgi:hypothetical protein|nr:hypothetical protein [Rhodanobacteraceae bacterium]